MKRQLIYLSCLSAVVFMTFSCMSYMDVTDGGRYGCIAVSGMVVGKSADGGQVPVEGLKVTVDYGSGEIFTVYTSPDGVYMSEFYTSAYSSGRLIKVTVTDEDGMENGFYASAEKSINHSSSSGFVGGDGSGFVGTKLYVLDFLLEISGR